MGWLSTGPRMTVKNPYRLISPSPGWARLFWPKGHEHDLDVRLALSIVRDIPGCQLGDGYAELPHTTWMLDVWDELLEATGQAEPPLPAVTQGPFEPRRPPYPFQQEAIDFALDEGCVLIADDMGLGKSTEAAVAAETMRRASGGSVVIIAPLMVRGTWKRELLAVGAIEDDSQFCALESRDSKHESFRREARYYFVHYDIARAWWSRLNALGPRKPKVAIVDEVHWVRNSRTQRSKGTLMLAGTCKNIISLTGTPLDNRPSDLWFPLTLTTGARTWGGPLDFRRRYAGAYHDGYGYRDGEEPTHTLELQARLKPFYLRRTAEQVGLQLPALTRSSMRVTLDTPRQREHDDVLQGASLEQIVRAVSRGAVEQVLPTLTRLRQITSVAKISTTVDYVHNLLDQGESLVVFCWERETVHRLAGRIDGHTLTVEGSLPQDTRDEQVRRFQEGTEPTALLATMGSLREGVTLHRGRIVVMHDLHWVLSHMLQAEKRIHRIGQHRPCQSVWMLADDSIDTILAPTLIRKAELMKDVLGIEAGVDAARDLDLAEVAGEDAVEEQVELALRAWRMA